MTTPTLSEVVDSALDEAEKDDKSENLETTSDDESLEEQVDNTLKDKTTDEVQDTNKEDGNKSKDENFTKINPDDLPDELSGIYKSLQADYTRKRQADSKRVKDLEGQVEELKNLLEQSNGLKQGDAQSTEYENYLSEEDRIRQLVRSEREAEWESNAQKDIISIDTRLNENHPDFDEYFDSYARGKLDEELSNYVKENGTKVGFDYKSVLDDVNKSYKAYIDKNIKSFNERQKTLAKKKEAELKKQAPRTSSADSVKSGNMSLDDAIEVALQN